jgi:hypothetical protein
MEQKKRLLIIKTFLFGNINIETLAPEGDWWHVTATRNGRKNEFIRAKWHTTDDVLGFLSRSYPDAIPLFLELLPEDDSRRVFAK